MFNIGPGEIIVIALVLLIAVGPEQLPSMIRRIGSAVAQVRGMTDNLRSEFMAGLDEIDRAVDPNAWAASAGPSDNAPKPKPKPRTAVTPPTGPAEQADDAEADSAGDTAVTGNDSSTPPLDPASAARAAGAINRRLPSDTGAEADVGSDAGTEEATKNAAGTEEATKNAAGTEEATKNAAGTEEATKNAAGTEHDPASERRSGRDAGTAAATVASTGADAGTDIGNGAGPSSPEGEEESWSEERA